VPVTARLSSRFYEQLGDETANELVNWLNAVDAEFRNDLRERDERNWERFRAELGIGMAQMRAEMAELRAAMTGEMSAFRSEVHGELRSHLRWMFIFWVTTLLALIGLRLI
jgi:hypothetical protein